MTELISIDTPAWVTAATWPPTGGSPWWWTRSATSTGYRGRRPARGPDHPCVRDTHPQRLRDRRPRPGPGDRRGVPRNAADEVTFDRVPVGDGDAIGVGDEITVRVIATPGHTFTHLSYALQDAATGRVAAVFTGGSLLYGATGRPDLLGPAHQATLAAAQHASAHRLAAELPDDTPVYPTHGFGSFCAATEVTATRPLPRRTRTPPPPSARRSSSTRCFGWPRSST